MEKHLSKSAPTLADANTLKTRVLTYVVTIAMASSALFAQEATTLKFAKCDGSSSGAVLVVDLTTKVDKDHLPTARFLSNSSDAELLAELDQLLTHCSDTVPVPDAKKFLKELKDSKTDNRYVSTAGAVVRVYVLSTGVIANIQVKEEARNLKIRDDASNLLRLLLALRKNKGGPAAADVDILQADYTLTERRAHTMFYVVPEKKAAGKDDPPAQEKPGATDDASKRSAKGASDESGLKIADIVTGEVEHFSLSANLPVNSVKQLDYDEKTKTLKTNETPKEFLLGFDAYYGDVLSSSSWCSLGRLGAKGLIRFSKQPLDQVGLVAAYRANAFSIIAGPIWNRVNRKTGTAADGTDITAKHYKVAWRVGLGFDLAIAKEWLTSSAKK